MTPSTYLAYITGIAIGDGNISNPNGRAYRLRITCDIKYPKIIDTVRKNLAEVFPDNKVSSVSRSDNALDISVYSNKINGLFGWYLEKGKKNEQIIKIPSWIETNEDFIKNFIKGIFESDGSIYNDRGYLMANVVSYNKEVVDYTCTRLQDLGFSPKQYHTKERGRDRYTMRVSKRTQELIDFFNIQKI